jgi:hypothetical protein
LLHRLVKPAAPPAYPGPFNVENRSGCCLARGVLRRLHTPPCWRWPCGLSVSCQMLTHPRPQQPLGMSRSSPLATSDGLGHCPTSSLTLPLSR